MGPYEFLDTDNYKKMKDILFDFQKKNDQYKKSLGNNYDDLLGENPFEVKMNDNSYDDILNYDNPFGKEQQKSMTDQVFGDNPFSDTSQQNIPEISGDESAFSKAKGNIGDIISFGKDAFIASQGTGSESGDWMNMANLTAKGAMTGAKIGGPIGGIIGGGLGLATGTLGVFKGAKDRKNLKEKLYREDLENKETKRERDQRLRDAEESLNRLTDLRRSQLGYLNENIY